jgi:hypothetical protein
MTTPVALSPSPRLGAALIALAVGFNLPFVRLGAVFDYPGILRRPAAEILRAFVAGGPSLILTWYAFALAAMAFLPVGMAYALGRGRITHQPVLAVMAAVAAALAGLTQAMGLLRWVMVVPGLAQLGDEAGFALLHAYAGVAVGEHLGQTLTALFVVLVAQMQRVEGRPMLAGLGFGTAAVMVTGAFEGVALAIGQDGSMFGIAAVAGYVMLTLWLIGSGVVLILRPRHTVMA